MCATHHGEGPRDPTGPSRSCLSQDPRLRRAKKPWGGRGWGGEGKQPPGLPWDTGVKGRNLRGRTAEGEDCVCCFGLGNRSPFAGMKEQLGDNGRGGPIGGAGGGEREPSPARTEGAERGRNCPLSARQERGVRTFQKTRRTQEREKGRAGASHCPSSCRRWEATGKSSLPRASRSGSVAGTLHKGPLPEQAH